MTIRGITIVGTSATTRGAYGWPCFHCGKPKAMCSRANPCCKKCGWRGKGKAAH